jgi:hypothetical protein
MDTFRVIKPKLESSNDNFFLEIYNYPRRYYKARKKKMIAFSSIKNKHDSTVIFLFVKLQAGSNMI